MLKKLIKTSLLGAVLGTVLIVSAMAASQGGGTVTASALNLRAGSDTSHRVLSCAPRGSGVVILDKAGNNWYQVWYNGIQGYMSGDYLALSTGLDGNFGYGTIQGMTVRMRSGPGFDSATLSYYNTGTEMTVIGVNGPWYKVNYNGAPGYVHSDYMSLSSSRSAAGSPASPAPAQAPAASQGEQSVTGQAIVNAAMKYLDVPYVWAGTSPYGFDCSGFVYYVYRECGYSVNRTAALLYQNGSYVDKSALQVGDVICFTTSSYYGIGHCGIYIGNGQFIHASSGTGRVVITGLNTNYYLNHYFGARRIV